MRITVVGRGNVGGLADLWERAGHQVTRIGRDGGDVSDSEAMLIAVPGAAIAEARAAEQPVVWRRRGSRGPRTAQPTRGLRAGLCRPLENAGAQERFLGLVFAIAQGGIGPFVYRIAPPEQL
jgi:hypothetical protein